MSGGLRRPMKSFQFYSVYRYEFGDVRMQPLLCLFMSKAASSSSFEIIDLVLHDEEDPLLLVESHGRIDLLG